MHRILLIFAVCLGLASAGRSVEILPTVESGHWAYAAMQELSEAGLVKGDWSGDIARTRHEFAIQMAALPDFSSNNDGASSQNTAYLQNLANKINAEFGPEIASLKDRTVALESEIENAAARIDALDQMAGELIQEVKTRKYGGTSTPAVAGSFGFIIQDLNGDGLVKKHNSAMALRLEMSVTAVLGDGASINVGFAPGFTPAAWPRNQYDDADEMKPGAGATTRASALLSGFKVELVAGPTRNILGQQFVRLSTLTLTGPLSNRPEMFWRSPYAGNQVSKAYFEGQFLTGVPKRAPEDFQHATMGWVGEIDMPYDLRLKALTGQSEGSIDAPASYMREHAGMLTLDKSDSWGGKVSLMGVNISNDGVELKTAQGVYVQPLGKSSFNGLMNNNMASALWEQKIKKTDISVEVTHSDHDSRINGTYGIVPISFVGTAFDFKASTQAGPFKPFVGYYQIPHDFIRRVNLGTNFISIREHDDPAKAKEGKFVQDTIIADPSIPITNSSTWNVGTELRAGPAFFKFNLQNSSQMQPSGPPIGASHYLGGENLKGGTWWVLMNNNYAQYVHGGADNNPALNRWNRAYTQLGTTMPLHNLEAYAWRRQHEFIVNTKADGSLELDGSGLPYSKKNISHFSTDMRVNISSIFGWSENIFWHVYLDGLTVNDDSLLMPSLSPGDNLFIQSVVDSTIIATVSDNLTFLLNMAYETWRTDRIVREFVDVDGISRIGTVEYQDRQAGVGLDWNIIPGKLNLYMRTKIFYHTDVSNVGNNFLARQMWWEMKSYY